MNKLIAHIVKILSGVDIAHLQDEIDALHTKNIQLTYDVKDAQVEISYRRTQWAETNEALEKAKAEIAELQATIARLKKTPEGKQGDLFSTQTDNEAAAEHPSAAEEPQEEAVAEQPSAAEELQEEAAEQSVAAEEPQEETAAEQPSAAEPPQEEAAEQSVAAEEPQEEAVAEQPSAAEPPQEEAAEQSVAAEEPQEEAVAEPLPPESGTEATQEKDLTQQITHLKNTAPYIRITLQGTHTQLIFEAKSVCMKTGLFEQGVEGHEIIEDKTRFITLEEIDYAEPMDSPFAGEAVECNLTTGGNGTQIVETLVTAVCGYHPIRIAYREKNGRTAEHNLRHICFKPIDNENIRLPHKALFADMMDGNINATQLMAHSERNKDIRTFDVSNIHNIQVFDAYVTDETGVHTQIQGLYDALVAGQPDMADTIYRNMPEPLRREPDTIRRRAHCMVVEGNDEQALTLYRSIPPGTETGNGQTWQELVVAEINELTTHGVAPERFNEIKNTLIHAHT